MMASSFVVPDVSVTAILPVGVAFTTMSNVHVLLHPFASVTLYVIVCVPKPAVLGVNTPPLTPVPLKLPPVGLNGVKLLNVIAIPFKHAVWLLGQVIIGSGFTMIVTDVVDEQPLFVTVTVYVVVLAGVTDMLDVVAPVVHAYVPPPVAAKFALAPAHIVLSLFVVPDVSVAVIPATGNGVTVIVCMTTAVHPAPLDTVTVYVVVVAGLTVLAADVLPPSHR
jgi:hypothetical protein